MQGVLINKCVCMQDIMDVIGDEVGEKYQWFAVYYEFALEKYPDALPFSEEYVVVDWKTLKEVMKDRFQIIWGSFSAIPKGVSKQEIMDGGLVDAEIAVNKYFKPDPRKIDHPLADMEILFCDGTDVAFLAKNEALEQRIAQKFTEYDCSQSCPIRRGKVKV